MAATPPIYFLTGCTAVGKTEISLAWAEQHDAEIISADALLFYRGMDIGTAKPTAAERARVPHHLIDLCEPSERMDVKRYAAMAQAAVREIEARGHRVLVVGGSGFYLKSFFAPVADDVPADAALRSELEAVLERDGLDELVRRLEVLNPNGLGPLDVCNPRRVLRALERCITSGRGLDDLAKAFAAKQAPFAGRELHLTELAREPDELRVRIEARVRAMLDAGLVDEVRGLIDQGLAKNPTTASAVGYRETIAWLQHPDDTETLVAQIVANTWNLVRKQRTWFRTQIPAHRIVPLPLPDVRDVNGLFSSG